MSRRAPPSPFIPVFAASRRFAAGFPTRSPPRYRSRVTTGRTGGNRTPNPRFWRPVLCQLSYCPTLDSIAIRQSLSRRSPIALASYLVSLCAVCLRQKRQNLLNSSRSRRLLLVLGRAVVAPLALLARQGDDVSHCCYPPARGRARGSNVHRSEPEPESRLPSSIPRSPRSCPRRPCGRLHESRTARPSRARPARAARR